MSIYIYELFFSAQYINPLFNEQPKQNKYTKAEQVWREISPQKSVVGPAFVGGVIDFNFSMGSPTAFIPSKSYFKFKLTFVGPPTAGADYLADNAISCMFNNVYFRAGGQCVSSCVNYVPQIQSAKTRLTKSKAWQESIGLGAYMIDSSVVNRATATGLASTTVTVLWQPPIGIFSHDKPMGAGDYRIQLNPNAGYVNAMIEKGAGANTITDITVDAINFYVCTVKVQIPGGDYDLNLLECMAQSKTAAANGNLDFNVPASTCAISVFVQSGTAGDTTRVVPLTKFTCSDGSQSNLRSLQLSYANVSKPSTRWGSVVSATENSAQQRYLETQLESDMVNNVGGSETYADWAARGGLYHFSFAKDASDKSTQLQLAYDFSALEAGANIFVLAWHYRRTIVTTESGVVVNVENRNV